MVLDKKETILEYVEEISFQLRCFGLTEQERLLIFFRGLRNEILEFSIFKDPPNFEEIITTARKMEHALIRWKIMNTKQDSEHGRDILDHYTKEDIEKEDLETNIDDNSQKEKADDEDAIKRNLMRNKVDEIITRRQYDPKAFMDIAFIENELSMFEKNLDNISIEIQNFKSREPGDEMDWDNFYIAYNDMDSNNGSSEGLVQQICLYNNTTGAKICIPTNLNSRYIDSEVRSLSQDAPTSKKELVQEEIKKWFKKPELEISKMLGEDFSFCHVGNDIKLGEKLLRRHLQNQNEVALKLLSNSKEARHIRFGKRKLNEFTVKIRKVALTKLHTFSHLVTNLKNNNNKRPPSVCIIIAPLENSTSPMSALDDPLFMTDVLDDKIEQENTYAELTDKTNKESYKNLNMQRDDDTTKRQL